MIISAQGMTQRSDTMVLYFTGTGNSKYIAEKIAKALEMDIVSINKKIKTNDFSQINSTDELIFSVPTYGWRIPRIVSDWIEKIKFSGCKKAYFVMNCGGEIGNAEKYLKKLCENVGFEYMGVKEIVMPENYIALFDAPDENEARQIIEKAQPGINAAIQTIKDGSKFRVHKANIEDKAKSSIVNDVFFKFTVKAKKFYTTESCTGCGACVALCPLNNIELESGKPKWGNNCTHCMACICRCPNKAIEYGKSSSGKPRYNCPNI